MNRWVHFDYASFVSGELKPRKVLPLLLKQYRNRWYLISFDSDKDNYITYALDRMEALEVSKATSERPKDFDPDNFFKHAIGITSGNDDPAEIILQASIVAAKYLDSLPIHTSQKVKDLDDDSVTFKLFVSPSEELIREILSYGGSVKVIEPKSLKKEIEKRALRLLGK